MNEILKTVIFLVLLYAAYFFIQRISPDEKEEEPFEQRTADTAAKNCVIEYWHETKNFVLILEAVCLVAIVLSLGNEAGWWTLTDADLSPVPWIFLFMGWVLFGFSYLRRVTVNGNVIRVRNVFGITRKYRMEEIDKAVHVPSRTVYYSGNRKLFAVPDAFRNSQVLYRKIRALETQD